ncbi:cysteine hydrolase family protein [Orrella marina]|uniref:Isochorismatase-like domain-containing protein n=1 Tax=Orrella marina TaxID=2163011 RepID=A0A2R4XFL3_9BURK|nr:isochorismatase family protein [Orrella marina]AWB32551.1 hypothetical protein DBV39_01145 [Orrella marina]
MRSGSPYHWFKLDPSGSDIGVYTRKRDFLDSPSWCLAGTSRARLPPCLKPGPSDSEYVKKKPSGFHGTSVMGYLVDRQIDTIIVLGGATSNCVRATVFDGASYNYRIIVPHDAVFDRFPVSHAISLFDMDRQFADVVDTETVLRHLSVSR